MWRCLIKFSSLLPVVLLMVSTAMAQPKDDFDTMMADAYASFRSAYWYTKTGNPGVASMEMMTFDMQWAGLRKSFEDAPPTEYAKDPEWGKTLSAITEANKTALEKTNGGDLIGANKAVVRIRDELSALRQRNGVTAFSDYVNAYWAVIEAISPLRDWDRELSEDSWLFLEQQAGELSDTVDAMAKNAPDALNSNSEFQETIQNNRQSIALFREHLDNRFERGAKGSIRDIRSNFGLLFLKYG